MSVVQILVLAGVAWFVVAATVGVMVGKVFHARDQRKPPHVQHRAHRKRPQNWPSTGHHH